MSNRLSEKSGTGSVLSPVIVEYDPLTGVPSEFNEFLPHDSPEYKRWRASIEGLEDSPGDTTEGQQPSLSSESGRKGPKKKQAEVVLETTTRSKKKSITSIHGLDAFDVKLNEAAKACGKKFASGASVNKSASGKEQIDIQVRHSCELRFGDFLQGDVTYELPDFLLSLYASKGLRKKHLFQIINKKKEPVYDSD
eukprot:g5214.t1